MDETAALSVNNLSKAYGSHKVLEDISFNLEPGQLAILRGPNGSGKTTLLNCISGLIMPDEGRILVAGHDLHCQDQEVRRHLVFIPDVPRFYLELTAYEHLHFIAAANDSLDGFPQRAEQLMRRFELWDARDVFPHHYSRGMRLKLGLLMGFIRPASVLLLDEPSSAIDAAGVALLEEELGQRKAAGQAILVSSHDLRFCQNITDKLISLHTGELEYANSTAA